ncbi:MAG: hypothetical protein ACFFD7_05645 [Candidatus Thorarchaeota archaeon]
MPYSYITIHWNLPKINSKNELRKFVVLKFMEEKPGQGTGKLVTDINISLKNF